MKKRTPQLTPPWKVDTLSDLFRVRVEESPEDEAYRFYDGEAESWHSITWQGMAEVVGRWQKALLREALPPGSRVGILLENRLEWVALDQAALGLGLVVVPLYPGDRPENIAYILNDCGVRLLLVGEGREWMPIAEHLAATSVLGRVISLRGGFGDGVGDGVADGVGAGAGMGAANDHDPLLIPAEQWLAEEGMPLHRGEGSGWDLATIIYTSGTTGRPKGVMLSHRNILSDVYNALTVVPTYREDLFLSFLPLSHALERTAGLYLPMMAGARVAFARSIPLLSEDLQQLRPTAMISVPRIYERLYLKIQAGLEQGSWLKQGLFRLAVHVGWQRFLTSQKRRGWGIDLLLWPLLQRLVAQKLLSRLGGRLRVAVCGGAPLGQQVARFLLGLGVPVIQGYGLTEASPVISVNPLEDNDPQSVGVPLPGTLVRIDEAGELLVKGPTVMMGYWNNPEASREVLDKWGWLHTGDLAKLENGHIRITGRRKEMIVLANGRKVPPSDLESAITLDPLFTQVMVVGEGAPYLSALVVLDRQRFRQMAVSLGLDPDDCHLLQTEVLREQLLQRIAHHLGAFPGHAKIRVVTPLIDPWTVENGLITPTLKLRRNQIQNRFSHQVAEMYAGHLVTS
ncbi:MAG: long-chain fatty acid--CoA ligase [Magnetococcales bacterium]|nr:long-chain fatty acid--CoA ligase [Magnetococcales bacterium]